MKSDPVEAVIEAMQSKAKPTKAANRAAKVIGDAMFQPGPWEPGWAARLIDLETGLPELIEACNALSVAESVMIGTEYGNELLHKAINLAKAALRKAEGT